MEFFASCSTVTLIDTCSNKTQSNDIITSFLLWNRYLLSIFMSSDKAFINFSSNIAMVRVLLIHIAYGCTFPATWLMVGFLGRDLDMPFCVWSGGNRVSYTEGWRKQVCYKSCWFIGLEFLNVIKPRLSLLIVDLFHSGNTWRNNILCYDEACEILLSMYVTENTIYVQETDCIFELN